MNRILITISALCIAVLVTVGGGPYSGSVAVHASFQSITGRIETMNRGRGLLDSGENEKAAAFFERELKKNPRYLEAADGVVEAMSRGCNRDGALQSIRSIAAGADSAGMGVLALFAGAAREQGGRRFGEAAAMYHEVAVVTRAAGDSLSSFVCLGQAAECLIGGRDGRAALETAAEALRAASHWPATGRLQAKCIALKGEACNLLDRLGAADSLYRDALQRARAGGYRHVTGYCLNGLGRLAEKRQDIEGAAAFYRDALVEMRALGARERTAALLNNLGQAETRLRHFDTARGHLEEARAIASSCGADWLLGYVLYGLGAIAELRGEHGEALGLFERSLTIHADQGNEWGALGARQRLGYNLIVIGEYPRAIEHYSRCLDGYEGMKSLYGLSWSLGGLALAYHRLGDFARAEEFYRRTIDVRNTLGDRSGVAWCLNSLGMVYDLQGRYREALVNEHEALAVYEALGDRSGIGTARFSIGSAYYYLGNYDESLSHYGEALAIATELSDEALIRRVVSGMGSVYSDAGRLDLAEEFYRRHLDSARESGARQEIAWALKNLASFYIELGRRGEARRCLDEARVSLSPHGENHIRAWVLYSYGLIEESNDGAIEYLEHAHRLARDNGLEELEWRCLSELGERFLAVGEMQAGREFQERAILGVERIRRRIGVNELRMHTLRQSILPYERMVSLLTGPAAGGGDPEGAFYCVERSRAQIFAALLREAFKRPGIGDDRWFDGERGPVSRLTYLQSRLQDGTLEDGERRRMLDEMARLEDELLRIDMETLGERDVFRMVYPEFTQPFDLPGTLRDTECALVYFLGRDRSFLFAVDNESITVHELPPRAVIEERVDLFLRLLRQSLAVSDGAASPGAAAPRAYVREAPLPDEVLEIAGEELFDMLLGPVSGRLDSAGTIVVVPDGLLNRLPFAMLRHHDRYVVERHAIFFAPSLRSLCIVREREGSRPHRYSGCPYSVIAVGSTGSGSTARGVSKRVYPFTNIPVEPLLFAEEEARNITVLFDSSLTLTGAEASERAFKAAPLDAAVILHIASHCYIDDADVRRSFLVLDPGRSLTDTVSSAAEDGLVQWYEVAGLRLRASLVTLSGCRSAGGVLAYGEGITGMTQAFLYAGADCVLASQIDIPDRLAHRFMISFYRNLRGGATAADALRETQLEAAGWNDAGIAPALWASFVLVGDGGVSIRKMKN
ncbi:MAG TPA: CHAT domain-containing tetratricopeptide repeat protein [Patescibacteria group bacterium]|nr:CHAT domain-containing tetratricopeptide repeat protein [Patescibacteria group bacterium]